MLIRVCLQLLLVDLCARDLVLVKCDVVLRNNGYTGITVALSPRILPERLPYRFARTVAELIDSASRKVYRDLNGRAFFGEVTLLVPRALSSSALVDSGITDGNHEATVSSRPSFGSSHFVIESNKDGVFGDRPYTLQYGSCGVPGLRTVLPLSYAAKADGGAMAEEWFRLRYGVFSEEPMSNDPLYSAISKQSVMCEARSARDVILTSNELSSAIGHEYWYKRVKLNIVKESPPRVVVVWNVDTKEPASYMSYVWRSTTLKALKKLAQVLVPDDTMMALVAYSTSMFYADRTLISMKTMKERVKFARSYPTLQRDHSNLQRAVARALELLRSHTDGLSGPQGTILLITNDTISQEDVSAAAKKLARARVRLHALLLSSRYSENSVDQLCFDHDGHVFLTEPSVNTALFYTKQANAMAALIFSGTSYAATEAPVMVKQRTLDQVQRGQEVTEVFYVDSKVAVTLRVDMVFRVEDTGSKYLNYVLLSSPTGRNYDARSNELKQQPFNVQQFKIENAAAGQWTLRVKPSYSALDSAKLEVWLAPTSIACPLISLRAWLSSSFSSVDPSKPFLIYAEVRKGSNPIRYAYVTATVIDPDEIPMNFSLVDNGAGDPDIKAGDGIYSRYFTGFSKKGRYKLSVTAKGSDESVVVNGKACNSESLSQPVQCRESQFPECASVLTEPFSRYFEYGSFFSLRDRPEGDIYPPSRITDLKVSEVDMMTKRITLQWTAPGNDYDHGAAKSYGIRYFDRAVDFALLFDTAGKEVDPYDVDGLVFSPKNFGEREKASFHVDCHDFGGHGNCYVAMRANDGSNYGPVSNVVEVMFLASTPPVPPDVHSDGDVTDSERHNDRNHAKEGWASQQLVLAVLIPLLFFLTISIIAVLFVCFRRRCKQDQDSECSSQEPTSVLPGTSAPVSQDGSAPKRENDERSSELTNKAIPHAASLYHAGSTTCSIECLVDNYENEDRENDHRRPQTANSAPLFGQYPRRQVGITLQGRGDHSGAGVSPLRPCRDLSCDVTSVV